MRSILCLLVVCLFTTTAAAQFGTKSATARNVAPAADTTQKKAVNSKGTAKKAGAAEQAGVEQEVIDAILVAMDLDHDGVVSQKEMTKTLTALRKVAKDKQGNITVPENAGANTNAAPGADAGLGQGPGGVGAPAGADQRNNNEATAWFMSYDKNGDGKLSPNEVPQQMRAALQAADTNGDGFIDAKEFQIFSRKMGDRAKAFSAGVNPSGVQGNGRAPKP
jgi:Ca2+-binding EF-hand superfamily protein